MQRRHFLHGAAAAALTCASGQLFATGATQPRLLVVFLRGGYDAASLLVPVGSSFYYESRPDIAIARPSGNVASALSVDGDWGLHPALRESIYPMFQKGEAAFVPFAGVTEPTRSHFETQAQMELGQSSGQDKSYRTGFLSRLAGLVSGAAPMSFTDRLPLIFQGELQVPNAAMYSISKALVDAHQSEAIASMYQARDLERTVVQGLAVRDEIVREALAEPATARPGPVAKGFEIETRRMARLMRAHYNIGFADVGGWDTHLDQGAASGYLAGRLEELGRGLAGFAEEMGATWRDTTVVVLSEFGRTFRQNGNRGTDHGNGCVYWVLGGSVRGRQIAGEQVRVAQNTLFQDRDYPVLNDYRAVLAGLFARLYGLNLAQNQQVFAGVTPKDLGLL
jgi:uncharacterized protein (DUF1501 family)